MTIPPSYGAFSNAHRSFYKFSIDRRLAAKDRPCPRRSSCRVALWCRLAFLPWRAQILVTSSPARSAPQLRDRCSRAVDPAQDWPQPQKGGQVWARRCTPPASCRRQRRSRTSPNTPSAVPWRRYQRGPDRPDRVPYSALIREAASVITLSRFKREPGASPPGGSRRAGGGLLLPPILLLIALMLVAMAYVIYALWPRWPGRRSRSMRRKSPLRWPASRSMCRRPQSACRSSGGRALTSVSISLSCGRRSSRRTRRASRPPPRFRRHPAPR